MLWQGVLDYICTENKLLYRKIYFRRELSRVGCFRQHIFCRFIIKICLKTSRVFFFSFQNLSMYACFIFIAAS